MFLVCHSKLPLSIASTGVHRPNQTENLDDGRCFIAVGFESTTECNEVRRFEVTRLMRFTKLTEPNVLNDLQICKVHGEFKNGGICFTENLLPQISSADGISG